MKTFLRYLITTVVGLLIVLAIVLAKNVFAAELKDAMQIWCDAFFVAGVVLVCIGCIVLASNGGVFYMLGYAVSLFFSTLLSSKVTRKYKTYYDYREAKQEKKKSFVYILVVGLVLIAVAAIFLWQHYTV